MADNSAGGQYQVVDPTGSTTDQTQPTTAPVAPTPNGQMPQQSAATPAVQPQQPASAQVPQAQPSRPTTPAAQAPSQQASYSQQTRYTKVFVESPQIQTKSWCRSLQNTNRSDYRRHNPHSSAFESSRYFSHSSWKPFRAAFECRGTWTRCIGQAAQAGLKQGQQIADQREATQANQDQQAQTDLRNRSRLSQTYCRPVS